MARARNRTLTGDERQLWETVARSARPLKPRPPEPAEAVVEKPEKPVPRKPAPPVCAPARPTAPPVAAPKLGPLDRRTRTRLSRGSIEVDGRLDLHGLTQSAAHSRLRRFLEEAQADGAWLVLVITGKGKAEDAPRVEERGVLRRAAPAWLESAGFRHLVAGFDEAGRRHGGAGALYVRLRRKKSAGSER